MPSIRNREARESNPVEQTPQGEDRRRRGKKGRTVVYVSDFMPPAPSSPSVMPQRSQHRPRQGKEDTKSLCVSGSGRAEGHNSEKKGRRAQLVSGALTVFPPGACLKKPTETSHAWQLHRKGKQRNPDTPFNHRAQFSKLKRTIYEVRKAVFESLRTSQDGVSPCGKSVNMERNSTERENPVEDASAISVDASACFSPKQRQLLRMRYLVTDMERMYDQIHKAMRQKHYARARQHMNQIRQLKKRLNTAALKWRLSTAVEVEADAAIHTTDPLPHAVDLSGRVAAGSAVSNNPPHDADVDGAAELTDEPNYVNFYPSLAQMGVGCHPLAKWIDRRSRKYPRRLGKDELPRLVEGGQENVEEEKRVVSTGPVVPSPVKYVAMCCTNIITDALDDLVFTILQQQYHLQRRMKKEKPLQFKARRLYSTGLRETLRGLRAAATRIPVVLIASDIEVHASWNSERRCDETAVAEADIHEVHSGKKKTVQAMGVDGTLEEIRAHCESHGIPLITCMSRHRLAYALFAKGCTVSAVLLHSAEGAHEEVRALRHYAQHLCKAFATLSAAHDNIPHAS
ncbi:hypothetical protein MOQ_001712 [Trypanosoma cruzi marinkellei]|uniref:Ribosomal protein L7Ae/L30e/S12e/Gadd45 domain-containing protein n=1 Tax=Trypanosoma cruzi marinkellei TaxID=85056 RepID=K2NSW4_TRYCR|nr:hypothetical protein MOQ_001712 [Trypanosoma cruzi marinkellei]